MPNVLVDRSERGGKINTEDDTEERDSEELNLPNKPTSSSKALDSITTLKIEVKGSKGKDIDINIYDEPNAPDEEHKGINTALVDDDEHLENNERNNLCPHSAKIKNAENNPGSENSWKLATDMSEKENAVDSEEDTEKRGREEQKPPNKFESLIKNMNDSISTLRPEAKDNKVIKINGRKDEKETVSNDSKKKYIRKLPKTMTVDLSRKGILVLGTEATLDANGGNEDYKANMDPMTEIIEHCDDDTEDMLREKTTAGGTSNSNIMTTLEVESKDSKAIGRGNEKGENAIISRPDNYEIDGIISNKEIASTIGITNEDNGNKVDGNEEKLEEKSFVSLVVKHWKDETKSHPNNTIRKDCRDDENMKIASTDTHDTDSTGHEKVENDPVRKVKEDAHYEENIIKTPT